MSDEEKQDDGELFDTDLPDTPADDASPTEEGDEKPKEGDTPKSEKSEETLDLEVPKPKEKEKTAKDGKKNRQKQVEVWQDRVESGKVKLEDVPKKWLREAVEANLEDKGFIENDEADLDVLVERKIAEREELLSFDALKKELNSAELTKDQKSEVEATFKDLVRDGLSKFKALNVAMKVAGLEEIDIANLRAQKARMKLPKSGNFKDGTEDITEDNWRKKLSFEERRKKLIELADTPGGGSINV